MKRYFFLIILFSFGIVFSQDIELKNSNLKKYYDRINNAENAIIKNNMQSALEFYKNAFKINEKPHAKDLFNSMQVAIYLKNKKFSNQQYHKLKCLRYNFTDDFLIKNKEIITNSGKKCTNKFNENLKKTLDSLMFIDQKYRLLSGGNYAKYKKEIAESDSIVSFNLVKLIDKHGFPNEYDIGLDKEKKDFSQRFYTIIFHQLAGSTFTKQRVNFSGILMKALEEGKITPQKAAFLIDLNDGGLRRFDGDGFAIHNFIVIGSDINENIKKTKENFDKKDCCYVYSTFYFPQKRNERIVNVINTKNENRKKLGLCSTEEIMEKNKFTLKNNDFIFQDANIITHAQPTIEDVENIKKRMLMIKLE